MFERFIVSRFLKEKYVKPWNLATLKPCYLEFQVSSFEYPSQITFAVPLETRNLKPET
jgi:hypothetical protein